MSNQAIRLFAYTYGKFDYECIPAGRGTGEEARAYIGTGLLSDNAVKMLVLSYPNICR